MLRVEFVDVEHFLRPAIFAGSGDELPATHFGQARGFLEESFLLGQRQLGFLEVGDVHEGDHRAGKSLGSHCIRHYPHQIPASFLSTDFSFQRVAGGLHFPDEPDRVAAHQVMRNVGDGSADIAVQQLEKLSELGRKAAHLQVFVE